MWGEQEPRMIDEQTAGATLTNTVSYGLVTTSGERGLRVEKVDMFSSAGQSGIRAGDEITALAGQQIASDQDAMQILQDQGVGKTVMVSLWRDGQQCELPMTLVEIAVLDLVIEEADEVLERRIAP